MENYTVTCIVNIDHKRKEYYEHLLGVHRDFESFDCTPESTSQYYIYDDGSGIIVLKFIEHPDTIAVSLETSFLGNRDTIEIFMKLSCRLLENNLTLEVGGRFNIQMFEPLSFNVESDLRTFIADLFKEFDEKVTPLTRRCMPDDTFKVLQELGIEEPDRSRFYMFFWMIGYRIREFFIKLRKS